MKALEGAVDDARDPASVLTVIEKLHELALSGDVAAARVYLDRMLGPVRSKAEDTEDLADRPIEELAAQAALIPEVRKVALDAVLSDATEREQLCQRLAREREPA